MLEEMLKEYLEIKKQEEELTTKKNELATKIKEELKKLPNRKYDENGIKACVTDKITFKYNDQTAIINYITQKGLSDIYLNKSINTTVFNTELKNEGVLFENVKQYITKNLTESLTVSRGNK
ncbi:hypothetical protein [uncultured Clostridium sp.]|uniref:hypothetical protein n=1 Tax=uncultured Clostridium sp. TaxID=59620 RepID=UPI002615A825|nr:hypothetical protein [uncultured Clostridium sp.]